jgi:Fe-S-cluster containining protein
MQTTQLSLEDTLPLTCTRAGTCCHGNLVLLNPWELFSLAKEKKKTTREFRDFYTEFGGIKLRFDGKADSKGKAACSQYVDGFGCSVHLGRPMACRLFPIGRQIHNSEVQYIYQGAKFPCLDGCPDVVELPHLSVGEYLQGQKTEHYEKAQDAYLELMQNLADMAFELFLDTGLAESGDTKTLSLWETMGNEGPEFLANRIGNEWIDCLMVPEISEDCIDPMAFVQKHTELLQTKAQEKFGALNTNQEFHEASVIIMGVALHLAQGIGANREGLAEHWCETAKGFLNDK